MYINKQVILYLLSLWLLNFLIRPFKILSPSFVSFPLIVINGSTSPCVILSANYSQSDSFKNKESQHEKVDV